MENTVYPADGTMIIRQLKTQPPLSNIWSRDSWNSKSKVQFRQMKSEQSLKVKS
ncbi:hypothetical protein PAMP_006041 [Pampus punctatissimus]